MLPLKGLCYLEGSWPNYRKRTRSVLPPSQCSLSQQRPCIGRGRSFNDRKGFKKPGRRGRGQVGGKPSATSTKPGQSKEGQKILTVSVSSDSKNVKWSHESMPPRPLGKPSVIFERTRIKVINNEGVLPPQITPVGGRLSNFVEGGNV